MICCTLGSCYTAIANAGVLTFFNYKVNETCMFFATEMKRKSIDMFNTLFIFLYFACS